MALILVTGFPCCGKTTFVNKLRDYLQEYIDKNPDINVNRVLVVNEENSHINKANGYIDSIHEKASRGILKSAVDKDLNTNTWIILDSLNYIKGYRYELYCIARAQRVKNCCIYVDYNNNAKCDAWNLKRQEDEIDTYSSEVLCQLRKRYEYPNSRNKWDYPLFHVVSGDKEGEDGGDGTVFTALHSAANDSTSTGTDKEPTEEPVKKKSSWKPKKSTKSKAPETLETPLTTGEVSSSTTTAAPSVMRDGETLSFSGTFVNSLKDVHKVNKTSTTVLKATAQEGSADNSSSNVNSHNKKIPDTNIVWGLNLTPDEEKKQVQLIINYLVSKNQTCGNSSINDHMNKDTTTKNKSGSTANTNNADVILPNASTVSVPHMQANILYEINRVSTLITDKIIAHMKTHAAGPALSNTPISALYFEEYDCTFHFYSKLIPTTDLYRLKRQFVKINTIYPPIMNTDANSSQSLTNAVIVKTLGSSYIEFLTSQI